MVASPLSYKLMKAYDAPYPHARQAELAARENLGIDKYSPETPDVWVEASKILQEQQYELKAAGTADTEESMEEEEGDVRDIGLVEEIIQTEQKIDVVKKQLAEKAVAVQKADEDTEGITETEAGDEAVIKQVASVSNKKSGFSLFGCCNPTDQVVVQ